VRMWYKICRKRISVRTLYTQNKRGHKPTHFDGDREFSNDVAVRSAQMIAGEQQVVLAAIHNTRWPKNVSHYQIIKKSC